MPFSTLRTIKDPHPKGRGIPRRDGEPFSCGGERDVGLADASKLRRKRRGMRPEAIQKGQQRRQLLEGAAGDARNLPWVARTGLAFEIPEVASESPILGVVS